MRKELSKESTSCEFVEKFGPLALYMVPTDHLFLYRTVLLCVVPASQCSQVTFSFCLMEDISVKSVLQIDLK